MDNFRRPKRPKYGATVDGILKGRKKSSLISDATDSSRFRRPKSYQPKTVRPAVGNFQRSDGFHPAAQPAIATSAVNEGGVAVQSPPFGARGRRRPELLTDEPSTDKKSKKKAKKTGKSRNWKKIAKRTALAFGIFVLLAGSYFAISTYLNARRVLKGGGSAAALADNVDPSLLNTEGDGRVNILLLGKGGPGHDGADLTDTLQVASIDPVHDEAALVGVPRDLWVKNPDGNYMKINAVYATAKEKAAARGDSDPEKAGLDAIEQTMEEVLGIPIHYYTMVDFEAFRNAIDTVGGIDINVKEQLYDPTVAWENNWNPVIAAVGNQHFDGKRALLYARSRHGSARGDFDRNQRQREVIIALKDKVFSVGTFGNPVKINQLINNFGSHVQSNFSINEIMKLYEITQKISGDKVKSLGLADEPDPLVTTDNINGLSVVVPNDGIGEYGAIHDYVRKNLIDPYIRDENASIVILNGTSTGGLATEKADELKSFGYNVTQVADAPTKGYPQTVLVNLRGDSKKYTENYLEKRLDTKATSKLPGGINAGTADFVIILGQNETNN